MDGESVIKMTMMMLLSVKTDHDRLWVNIHNILEKNGHVHIHSSYQTGIIRDNKGQP